MVNIEMEWTWYMHRARSQGFCQVKKKSKNPRKTRKWVGGSGPNSDFNFLGGIFLFFVLFSCFQMLKKKKIG